MWWEMLWIAFIVLSACLGLIAVFEGRFHAIKDTINKPATKDEIEHRRRAFVAASVHRPRW